MTQHTPIYEAPSGCEEQRPSENSATVPGKRASLFTLDSTATLCQKFIRMMKESLLVRCALIFGLTLCLCVPLEIFENIIDERNAQYMTAADSIAGGWGGAQQINGPALIVPYQKKAISEESAPGPINHLVLLPKALDIDAKLNAQTLHRGIFKDIVFSAPIAMRGSFRIPDESPLTDETNIVHWAKAELIFGVTDRKAITALSALTFDGKESGTFSPDILNERMFANSLSAKVQLDQEKKDFSFSWSVSLNGTESIHFTPVGENTHIQLSGDWAHPNFDNRISPVARTITENGFSAEWSVSHISRSYPQYGPLNLYCSSHKVQTELRNFSTGVSLFESVSLYTKITRAVKYGILFIGLTFIALFSFELLSRSRLHLVQYGLVGVSMCLFYLSLLSLAEHFPFELAFMVAAAVSAAMNSAYIAAALHSPVKGAVLALLLAGLYGVLYSILQLESYATLSGTALLITVVCTLMFLTRNLAQQKNSTQPAC